MKKYKNLILTLGMSAVLALQGTALCFAAERNEDVQNDAYSTILLNRPLAKIRVSDKIGV